MKCDICGNETDFGNTYSAHLIEGMTAGPYAIFADNKTHYRYAGRITKYFCHKCVAIKDAKDFLIGIIVLILLAIVFSVLFILHNVYGDRSIFWNVVLGIFSFLDLLF